jgi:multidrug efflux pump subunit AcrB
MKAAPAFRTILLFTILSVMGYSLLPLLPLEYLPENKSSTLRVAYTWPNATPDMLEQKVTAPLEASMSLLGGVKKITSVSGFGSGSIRIQLDESAPVDLIKYQISNRLRQMYDRLPVGLSYPQVQVVRTGKNEDEQPLLIWSLSGAETPAELQRYALEVLVPQLSLEAGVGKITVSGGNDQELRILLRGESMTRLKLSKDDVISAIDELFEDATLGTINNDTYRQKVVLLRPAGDNTEELLAALKNLEVTERNGKVVRLSELADIEIGEQPPLGYYRVNGESGVRLLLYKSPGENSILVSDRMKARMRDLQKDLPQSLAIHLDHDEAEFLKNELQKVKQRTLWSLGILLLFVLVAYRNLRQLCVLVLGLAATLGISFIAYYFIGVQLHLYALAGITVSFGIIIDNAIVVIHHLRSNKPHSVLPALLASTLTTLAALVVLWRLPEEWKLNLLAFGQVLLINLLASLAVAWWLMPALLLKFGLLNGTGEGSANKTRQFKRTQVLLLRQYKRILGGLINYRKTSIAAFILLFGLPVFMLPNKIEGWDWYNKTIGSDWYADNLRPYIDKALGGTLRLFSWYVWEGSSWRQPEATQLYVEGKMPQGSTIEQLNEVFKYLEAYIGAQAEGVDRYITQIDGPDYGQIVITFGDSANSGAPYILKNKLIAFSLNFGGIKWNIYGVGRGFSNEGSSSAPVYQVKLTGYNRDQLQRYAARLAEKLAVHPRVRDIVEDANQNWWEKDRYVYSLSLDQKEMAYRGVSPNAVDRLMERFNRANYPDVFLPDGMPVKLIRDDVFENDTWRLLNQAQTIDSVRFFVPEIGQINKSRAPLAIYKEAQQYIQTLKFTYTGSYRFGSRFLNEKLDELKKEILPGYSAEVVEFGWRRDSGRHYEIFLLVVGLIFFICALTFESIRQPFVIILSIPLSFVGIFLTFYWFDFPMDQGGYTSFLMVSGLAVNGLILVVNDFNALRKVKLNLSELDVFVKAIHGKFLPIFLSVVSTVLGLVPFTMHGESEVFWFSLAVGTMGGLLFSLVVILFMMPVLLCRRKRAV